MLKIYYGYQQSIFKEILSIENLGFIYGNLELSNHEIGKSKQSIDKKI